MRDKRKNENQRERSRADVDRAGEIRRLGERELAGGGDAWMSNNGKPGGMLPVDIFAITYAKNNDLVIIHIKDSSEITYTKPVASDPGVG